MNIKGIIKGNFNKYKDSKLVKGSSAFLVIKIISLIFGYINVIIVTKYFGKSALGIFSYIVSIITIVGTFSGLGVEMTTLRFVSKFRALKDFGKVKSTYFQALKVVFIHGLLLSLFFFIFPEFVAGKILGKPENAHFIRFFAFLLIPISIRKINNQFQRAFGKIGQFGFVNLFFTPLTVIILFFILILSNNRDEATPTNAHFVSMLIMFVISIFFVLSIKKWKTAKITEKVKLKEIFRVSIPMYAIAITGAVSTFADKMILGYFVSNAEIGVYHAMNRTAMLIGVFLITANSSLAPKFSELVELRQIDELKKLVDRSTKYIALSSFAIFVGVMLISVPFINFLDLGLEKAFFVLLSMSIGELFNAWVGPVASFLLMSGHEKINQNMSIVFTVLYVVFNVVLIYFIGILGAAIATSLIIIAKNIIFVIIVKRKYNILFFYIPKIIKRAFKIKI